MLKKLTIMWIVLMMITLGLCTGCQGKTESIVVDKAISSTVDENLQTTGAAVLNTENVVIKTEVEESNSNITEVEEGLVFVGWNNSETQEKEQKAKFTEISDLPNVFAVQAVYGEVNSEIVVPLEMGGAVDMCAFDITIKYDTEKLRLLEIVNLDTDVVTNFDSVKGEIYMNFVNVTNIDAGFKICDFLFETKGIKGETELEFSSIEVVKSFENGDLAYIDSKVVKGPISLY